MITAMFRFETPWALAAVILPLLLWLWRKRRRSRIPALKVATADLMRGLPRTLRSRLAWLPAALMTAAWVLLTIALARPQSGQEQLKDVSQGIAIEMVLDRSGSMRFPMKYHGQQLTRLEVVKDVFADFAFGNRDLKLPGRHSDLLGVIAFAHYPYTICPLTLDHNALRFALKNVEMVTEDTDENGTAIGDAVAMAVARLETVEQTLAAQTKQDASTYRIKSKVIIVLTDG